MDELQNLESKVRERAAGLGKDPRQLFVRLREDARGGVWLECDDAEVLHAAHLELQPAVSRNLHARLVPDLDLQGWAAWVAASVAEVRREPAHAAEQVTQALQGENLEMLLHESGWVLGRLPDGYVGWVRDWHLRVVERGAPGAFAQRCSARIAASWICIRTQPQLEAEPCGETLLGTRVALLQRGAGWAEIELPGGRCGWLPLAALRPGTEDWPAGWTSIVAMLRSFQGVPYLWGGRSPKGFDCSGLVQFVFGLHGVSLPRDSDRQALCGEAVAQPAAGDLLFFGKDKVTHVGVAEGGSDFLHARGEVRRNSLAPGSPLHDPELRALYRGARRVLVPAA